MVIYEWDVEIVSAVDTPRLEEGEVIEHLHQTCYSDALALSRNEPDTGTRYVIVLVRDDDIGRSWAYVDSDGLPSHFSDAEGHNVHKVPQRFFKEILSCNA